jgi:hypothetical protein
MAGWSGHSEHSEQVRVQASPSASKSECRQVAIHHERKASRRHLSPRPPRVPKVSSSLAGDGTWMGPPTVSRGSGRRLEGERMARDPGGPERPLAVKRQQWRGAAGRPSASRCDRFVPGNRAEREAKDRTGTQIAATRVPEGNPRDREVPESRKALRETRAGLLGWATSPGLPRTAPAYPSHPRGGFPRGGRRVGNESE